MLQTNLSSERASRERVRAALWYYLGPPLLGAAIIAACVVPAALEMLFNPKQTWRDYFLALAAAAAIGFAGGAAYVIFGRALRRVPRIGPYLAGIVTMTAYMGTGIVLISIGDDKPMIKDRAGVIIFAVCTLVFGIALGYGFRRRTPEQVTRDQRAVAALMPLQWIAIALFIVIGFVIQKSRDPAVEDAALILGLIIFIGAWIFLKRRASETAESAPAIRSDSPTPD